MVTKPKKTVKETDPPKEPDPKKIPTPEEKALQEKVDGLETKLDEVTKKFGKSSTEGIRLAKEVKELKAKLEDNTPSEPPLEERIPDWDILSEEEKQAHRDKEKEKKRLAKIETGQEEEKKARLFNEGFDELVEKEEFKALAKKKAKFREYCNENPGMPLEAAAKSFLFDSVKEIAANEERKKGKRKGLESPTGGPKEPPTKKGYTAAEAEDLMKNHNEKYNRLVRENKLVIIDEPKE